MLGLCSLGQFRTWPDYDAWQWLHFLSPAMLACRVWGRCSVSNPSYWTASFEITFSQLPELIIKWQTLPLMVHVDWKIFVCHQLSSTQRGARQLLRTTRNVLVSPSKYLLSSHPHQRRVWNKYWHHHYDPLKVPWSRWIVPCAALSCNLLVDISILRRWNIGTRGLCPSRLRWSHWLWSARRRIHGPKTNVVANTSILDSHPTVALLSHLFF